MLNDYANLILAAVTAVSVLVTIVYVQLASETRKLMAKQIVSDLVVSNVRVYTSLESARLKRRLDNDPNYLRGHVSFAVGFDLRNRSSASGSIDKPLLVIEFPEGDPLKIEPVKAEPDLGGAFYTRGGESIKAKITYVLNGNDAVLAERIRKHHDKLKYRIEYENNLGKKFSQTVSDVLPED